MIHHDPQSMWGGRPRPPLLKLILGFDSPDIGPPKSTSKAADVGVRPTRDSSSQQ
jgi:hypothetical protein